MKVHIRWMIRRDMAEVLDIERSAFEFPWFEEEFIRCLRQRNCIGMVAEHAERVVGFMLYELHKTRLHILNFAVAADCRRCGVGSLLVAKLKSKLSEERRRKIVADIGERNCDAHLFFKRQGFFCMEIIAEHYERYSDCDCYRFEYQWDERECCQAAALFQPASKVTLA